MADREQPHRPLPHEKASRTARWSEIIFRALSARVAKRWHFVSFRGSDGGEWRGVVDLVAIRKDTAEPRVSMLKRGDLFEVVLVQVKGGSARLPTLEERMRLRLVAKHYRARAVVLFQWRRGLSSAFFTLRRDLEWESTTGEAIFG